VNAVDTSVAVAAFASWHERHERARATVAQRPGLAAQSALETYSVLTRLPEPHRVAGAVVATFLERAFGRPLTLGARRQQRLVTRLAGEGIEGGAVYDALIAVTAEQHGALLVTLDARAALTYARCGVKYELLAA
jgi:predicted nucleic acid-binding protein